MTYCAIVRGMPCMEACPVRKAVTIRASWAHFKKAIAVLCAHEKQRYRNPHNLQQKSLYASPLRLPAPQRPVPVRPAAARQVYYGRHSDHARHVLQLIPYT